MVNPSALVEDEPSALRKLADLCPEDVTVLESQAFDGTPIVQAVVALTATSAPVMKAWLKSRATERTARSITVDGKRMEGYSASDVERIMKTLDGLTD